MKHSNLTEKETAALNRGRCCDCSSLLVDGPCGSGSMNYYCSQKGCGSRFNMSMEWERISEPSPYDRHPT